jgi:DMSO/TMAO reductase YedYZ heme-binding membrane subunit
MFVIVAKYLIPKGFRGLTIFPFVILKHAFDSENKVLVNHEKIHIRQQLELLILPFFLWYFVEYAVRLLQYKNANLAYRNISFEREAYANEQHFDYLKNRSFFSFLSYLKTNKP